MAKHDPSSVAAICREAVDLYGTQRAVAEALGISESRVGKILKNQHSFSVLNCLQLAKITNRSPFDVLTLAGKDREAQLIFELCTQVDAPAPAPKGMSPEEREFIGRWRALPEKVRTMVSELFPTESAPPAKKRSTR